MLVLTRKQTESVWIGDDIEIKVIRARGNRVRLGIKAPPDISVHRHQIIQRMSHVPSEFATQHPPELTTET